MNKRKVAEIVKFNVEKNIQNKWFVILNIIMCLLMVVGSNLKNIDKVLEQHNINLFEEEFRLEIVDENGFAYGLFEEEFKDLESVEIKYIDKNNYTKDNIEDDVIIIEYKIDQNNKLKTTITTKESIDENVYDSLLGVTKKIRNQILALNLGIELSELESFGDEPEIERIMLEVDAENSDQKEAIKLISIVIIYMVLIFVLTRIANEIATEKLSKSIEYVLTSVSAKEYLLAKVLSITITIAIQLLYSLVYFMLGNGINNLINMSEITNVQNSMNSLDMSIVSYILVMVVYLIFTVFFMSMIQSAISSKTTSVTEASNTTMLLLMIVMVLYFISISAISPYIKVTTFMYVISCIPIVSTFFVPSMMIIGQATTLQIIVSFVMLVICTPLLFNKCSIKFKDGILDYTTKNKKNKKVKKERSIREEQEFLMKANGIKRFSFVIGLSLLLWFVLEQIGNLVLPYIVENIFRNILSDKSIIWIYYSLISIISFTLSAKLVSSYTEDEYKKSKKVNLKTGLKIILMGFGFVILIQYIESFVATKFGIDYQVLSNDMLVSSNDGLLDKILFVIGLSVVPGIFEELFVRKAILNYSKKFGNYFAIIISAIIFGLLHMNLQQGLFAICIGLVFGIIMIKTGDIRLTIILHILNNGLVAISSIVPENVAKIIEIITIAIAVLGIILFIGFVVKNKGLKIEKEKFEEEYKMIFRNYTFDLVIILFIVLTIISENYLRML